MILFNFVVSGCTGGNSCCQKIMKNILLFCRKFMEKCFAILSIFYGKVFCKFGLKFLWKKCCAICLEFFKEKYFANLSKNFHGNFVANLFKIFMENILLICLKFMFFAVSLKYSLKVCSSISVITFYCFHCMGPPSAHFPGWSWSVSYIP